MTLPSTHVRHTAQSAAGSVGLIGIGNMGFAILQRLCEQGWRTWVHDLDATRCQQAQALGAQVCACAAEVAKSVADAALNGFASSSDTGVPDLPPLLIVAVVDGVQAHEVLFGDSGVAAGLPPGGVVLLCPTLGPEDVVQAAERLAGQGICLLDAPMSGGPARARQGTMSLMLAGRPTALRQAGPLLDALSNQQFHLGDRVGDAARTKLMNNLLAAINLAGAAEVLALAQKLGLDGRQTLSVIEQSSGQSWIGHDRLNRALAGDLAPRAHTTLLAKDSALALRAASALGESPALGVLAAQRFAEACDRGGTSLDDACLFQFAGGRPEHLAR